MKRKRKYKIPIKHIIMLEVMYSLVVAIVIWFFNGSDFISLAPLLVLGLTVFIGSVATLIHLRLS
ncbi:MAG TPA: hypothetical protein EYG85_02815 [Crocinitomix sp.]|nr:hypothetical protein [Crocinitomix sp.]